MSKCKTIYSSVGFALGKKEGLIRLTGLNIREGRISRMLIPI